MALMASWVRSRPSFPQQRETAEAEQKNRRRLGDRCDVHGYPVEFGSVAQKHHIEVAGVL